MLEVWKWDQMVSEWVTSLHLIENKGHNLRGEECVRGVCSPVT